MTEAPPAAAADRRWYQRREVLFGLALFVAAAVALSLAFPRPVVLAPGGWPEVAFFLLFSLFAIAIGYPHPTFGHVSFDRVAQVSAILVLGPVEAAWITGLASFAYPLHRLRKGVPLAKAFEASLTNAGLMTLVVLAGGSLYAALGGAIPLERLDLGALGLLLLMIVVMQVLNELGMAGIFHFRDKNVANVVSAFETLTELISSVIAILVAIVYTRMELEVFMLLLFVLSAGMLGLKQFADMRRQLEQIVAARTEALREKTLELEQLATRDMLTGLRNRRYAEDFLQRELEQAQRYGHDLSLALADIDYFKQINDGHSHAVGDRVLQRVATIFDERIRSTDLIARYGGEEFLFCFTGTGEDLAAQVCEDLRRTIEDHDWPAMSPGLAVTVSVGVVGRKHGTDADAMVAAADARLYRAKHMGRNRVVAEATVTPLSF